MNRNALKELISHKESGFRKPFLLYGTNGTGKTWLALDFARSFFSQYLYVNLEHKPNAAHFFSEKILSGATVSEAVAQFFQMEEEYLSEILVIFDEITYCPALFLACEKNVSCPLLLISGSVPEPEVLAHFQAKHMYPMTFDEFLDAVGSGWYIDMIQGHYEKKESVPNIVHQDLLALFEEYLEVGGMPSVINEYVTTNSPDTVAEQQYCSLIRIQDYLCKNSEPSDSTKALQIMNVMTEQLERSNKNFKFNTIRKGITYNMVEDSLKSLVRIGAVIKTDEFERNNDSSGNFKLYYPDVGLLSYSLFGNTSEQIRKAKLENYLMEQFSANGWNELSFWESKGMAKVDILLKKDGITTPVEIRDSNVGKGKSIVTFFEKNSSDKNFYFRFCNENLDSTDVCYQLPFYAAFCIKP
mgnify:CR=1 FL=1